MPWTLVPHAAIAVDPHVTYVRARRNDEVLIPQQMDGLCQSGELKI